MILTVDLGTSATKAAVWDADGVHGTARVPLSVRHGGAGRVEQEAGTWWPSVLEACGGLDLGDVEAVVASGARQSFVPVSSSGDPLGAALLWSDRRAVGEAAELAASLGGAEEIRERTGMVLDGAAVAAKLAWLARHDAERLRGAAWILSPRDLVVWEMTGEVATDATSASATGLYDAEGTELPGLVGPAAGRLPQVVSPGCVIGKVRPEQAGSLGLRAGTPVVMGAGDRPCEVLGAGASALVPMVAWGTTANVSVPVADRPAPIPAGLTVTRGALGGWLIEGGLSAAGSLLAWVADLTGVDVDELATRARACPPGAGGVTAMPWLGGARAPWWRDDARAGFMGLGPEHGPGELARAAVEAVAFDVERCLEAMGATAQPCALAVGGSSPTGPLWLEVVTGVTGLPAWQRRSGEAAMAGAALVASAALGTGWELEHMDPVETETAPSPEVVERYGELRLAADRAAAAALGPGAQSPGREG